MIQVIFKIIIILILTLSFGCKHLELSKNSFDSCQGMERDTIGKVELITTIIAREICGLGNDSIYCFDDVFQDHLYPGIIGWEGQEIDEMYKNRFISFPDFDKIKVLIDKDIFFNDHLILDSLFRINDIGSNRYVVKSKINRGLKRNYNVVINNKIQYCLYKVKLKLVYGGRKCIVIPNFEYKKKKDEVFTMEPCDLYYLLDIISIKPFTEFNDSLVY